MFVLYWSPIKSTLRNCLKNWYFTSLSMYSLVHTISINELLNGKRIRLKNKNKIFAIFQRLSIAKKNRLQLTKNRIIKIFRGKNNHIGMGIVNLNGNLRFRIVNFFLLRVYLKRKYLSTNDR